LLTSVGRYDFKVIDLKVGPDGANFSAKKLIEGLLEEPESSYLVF